MSGRRTPGAGPVVAAVVAAVLCAVGAGIVPAQAAGPLKPVLVWERALYGPEKAPLVWPVAVASAAPGEVVVLDAAGPRLVVLLAGEKGWTVGKDLALPSPPAALVAANGGYVMSLRGKGEVLAIDRKAWTWRPVLLPAGVRAGALGADRDGRLLVADLDGDRLLALARGRVVAELPAGGRLRAVTGGSRGVVWAVSADGAEVRRLGAKGVAQRFAVPGVPPERAFPSSVALAAGGDLLVTDQHAGRVVVLDASGRPVGVGGREGRDEGLLLEPVAVSLAPDGRVLVADRGNGRVQIYRRAETDATR